MAIDGVGQGPGVAPTVAVDGSQGPEAAAGTGKVFDIDRAASTRPNQGIENVQSDPGSPLARLQAGHIDLGQYLDLKVESATGHLQGLSSDEMSAVRRMLRDTLETDPSLIGLVRSATGQVPAGDE